MRVSRFGKIWVQQFNWVATRRFTKGFPVHRTKITTAMQAASDEAGLRSLRVSSSKFLLRIAGADQNLQLMIEIRPFHGQSLRLYKILI